MYVRGFSACVCVCLCLCWHRRVNPCFWCMCAWDVCLDGVQPVGWQQTEASCSESDGRNFCSYGVIVNPGV